MIITDKVFKMRNQKVCRFTEAGVVYIDYKDTKILQRFISEQGRIIPKRITGTSAKYHRELTLAIKRARHMALMPFVSDTVK
ncbi:MAG: 30S ribosomal protein S18 [Ignavibacteriaceae bacterium]|jgi:small subunit ribosomal protein S18|nr:30S ribosomal protein S18 [Ignavibacteriaceae bacterium]